MLGRPKGGLTRSVMGCKDTLGPYWTIKPGHGPISEGHGPISEGQGPISGGQGPDSEGQGPNKLGNRPISEGQGPISEGHGPVRRSARRKCQSSLQKWEGASTSKGKAGRGGKSLHLERLTIPGGGSS